MVSKKMADDLFEEIMLKDNDCKESEILLAALRKVRFDTIEECAKIASNSGEGYALRGNSFAQSAWAAASAMRCLALKEGK